MDDQFLNDDYFSIIKAYFDPKKIYFNPAQIAAKSRDFPAAFLPQQISQEYLQSYHNDSTPTGLEVRKILAEVMSEMDGNNISPDKVTLCPTITAGSAIVLSFLKEQGVNQVWLETPCYYATLFQMKNMGIKYRLIPTYAARGYSWNISAGELVEGDAVWLTHPRISIGSAQPREFLIGLCKKLQEKKGYVIVDEATELATPSLLSDDCFKRYESTIIRLRGVFKPLGLNGPRISMMLHSREHIENIKKWVWIFQGGLDCFSMSLAKEILKNIKTYKALFARTREDASTNFLTLRRLVRDTSLILPNYEDGYTSSLTIPLLPQPKSIKEFYDARNTLIQTFEKLDVFPTLGASMYFAHDEINEHLRLNYLGDIRSTSSFISKIIGSFM